ncbi:PREDICTED: uncharacterized protein LOC109236075 [Nicotiana attenuata]|uniref:uncharacterized protein LOC109221903 n=1 Tax=Nicotiana attenuata TaxID=49451 RepID=UPI000905356B|nr:PREDICTED: uncharacterized protein LOC109221903 [Nicotiana attenuata]XP_019257844.1 PREDICTED: uncharacterized protein LOC109236075 [Nicotiana attenuata]
MFMEVPQGLQIEVPDLVCKLNKSLYGLKQASRQWYDKLTTTLCTRGFRHSENNYSLFYKKNGFSIVFVAVYVDDVILTGTDIEEIKALKSFLHDQFKIKDLGKLHYFLDWKCSTKAMGFSFHKGKTEYRSIRKVVGELVWLKRLLEALTVPCLHPIPVFCDRQAALHMARNPVFYEHTNHIEVDCYFVRDKLYDGLITLHHISTDIQLADILTKALTGIKHSSVLSKLAVSSSPPT